MGRESEREVRGECQLLLPPTRALSCPSSSSTVSRGRGSGGTLEVTRCVRSEPLLGAYGGALVLGRVRGPRAYAQDHLPPRPGAVSYLACTEVPVQFGPFGPCFFSFLLLCFRLSFPLLFSDLLAVPGEKGAPRASFLSPPSASSHRTP